MTNNEYKAISHKWNTVVNEGKTIKVNVMGLVMKIMWLNKLNENKRN